MPNEIIQPLALYELINPSDGYTFYAESDLVAQLTAKLLSDWYFAKRQDGETVSVEVTDDDVAANWEATSTALESLFIVGLDEREAFDCLVASKPDADRAQWLEAEHDRRRSSMNDIRSVAAKAAAGLRKHYTEAETSK